MIEHMNFVATDEGLGVFEVAVGDLSIRLQLIVAVQDRTVSDWSPEQLEAFRNDVNLVLLQAQQAFHQLAVSTNPKGQCAYYGISPEVYEDCDPDEELV